MTSLAEQRAAIRAGISASRSSNLAEQRAAIRAGIQASRASTIKRDLNSLETSRRQAGELLVLERRGTISAARGTGVYRAPTGGTGSGIASPLTELTKVVDGNTVPDRDYYPDQTLTSSDGLFSFEVRPINKLKLTDANDALVEVVFAVPAP
jgi:hypothetical protein